MGNDGQRGTRCRGRIPTHRQPAVSRDGANSAVGQEGISWHHVHAVEAGSVIEAVADSDDGNIKVEGTGVPSWVQNNFIESAQFSTGVAETGANTHPVDVLEIGDIITIRGAGRGLKDSGLNQELHNLRVKAMRSSQSDVTPNEDGTAVVLAAVLQGELVGMFLDRRIMSVDDRQLRYRGLCRGKGDCGKKHTEFGWGVSPHIAAEEGNLGVHTRHCGPPLEACCLYNEGRHGLGQFGWPIPSN